MIRNPKRLNWIREVLNKLPHKPPVKKIGKNVRIHPTVVWDDEGYTMERDEKGNWLRGRQHGDIVVEDNVHIGSNCVIKRSTMPGTATRIGEDSKLCSFVNVGHNCNIGKHVFISPHVCLNGGVEIGDDCYIAGHAVIEQHVKIGEGAIIGMGAVVTDDVPPGQTVVGVPARQIKYKDNHIHPSFRHGRNFKIGKYNVIHENCRVGDDVQVRSYVELRPGTVIGDHCYIDSGVKSSGQNSIGSHVVIRYDAIIAREVTVESGTKDKPTFISPQVMTIYSTHEHEKRGGIVIGSGAFIGTSAVLGPAVKIGPGVVIGTNAYVNKDCLESGIYVGVPARRLKKNLRRARA